LGKDRAPFVLSGNSPTPKDQKPALTALQENRLGALAVCPASNAKRASSLPLLGAFASYARLEDTKILTTMTVS
jgi:hypothetical protein